MSDNSTIKYTEVGVCKALIYSVVPGKIEWKDEMKRGFLPTVCIKKLFLCLFKVESYFRRINKSC